jgi:heterodisulfide reductase subunit A-like polyferredoxin
LQHICSEATIVRSGTLPSMTRILYCHCAYAQVVPKTTKEGVLEKLCASGVSFEACADLCEMSARKDPALKRFAEGDCIKIAACYPRAVKSLFRAAGAPLPQHGVEILNMRVDNVDSICSALDGNPPQAAVQ